MYKCSVTSTVTVKIVYSIVVCIYIYIHTNFLLISTILTASYLYNIIFDKTTSGCCNYVISYIMEIIVIKAHIL